MPNLLAARGNVPARDHPERLQPSNKLVRKATKAWRIAASALDIFWGGSQRGLPGLANFAVGNPLFRAVQQPDELTVLGEILAALCPERALEIGTARGGTLFFLTRLASPHATILSVDLPGGRFGGGYSRARGRFYGLFARRGQRLLLFRGDSHTSQMVDRVTAALGGLSLDYLFIDGDHSYEGVKRDFELYAPLVRRGGIIALHDIAEHSPEPGCEVPRFWKEIKPRYSHTEIIANPRQGWGIGVVFVS